MAVITAEVEAAEIADHADDDVRVWCTGSGVAAAVVGGFCACCGAHDHDWL